MSDKRSAILAWLDEQEALCKAATPGPWKLWGMTVMDDPAGTSNLDDCREIADTFDPDRGLRTFNASFMAQARTALPLALAALRAEVERHERIPEWRNDEDKALGFELGCYCQSDSERPSWPCSTIDRIHAALRL